MDNSNRTILILVTSATGNQGSAVAHHLLAHGNFQVRDRTKPEARSLKQAGAGLITGDLTDRSSLDRHK